MKKRKIREKPVVRRGRVAVSEYLRRRRLGELIAIEQYLSEKPQKRLSPDQREELRNLLLAAEGLHLRLEKGRRIRFEEIYARAQKLQKVDRESRMYFIEHPEKMN